MEFKRLLLLALFVTLFFSVIQGFPTTVRQESDASPEPSESPEESAEPEEVCVDAKHLSNYPSHMLVHSTAIRAPVLCPPSALQLPCATADHKLRVNGKSMSYRQYCNTVSCEKKRMPVNSVLSHLWKETSHDNGNVVLTMYDARHPETLQTFVHRITSLRRSMVRTIA